MDYLELLIIEIIINIKNLMFQHWGTNVFMCLDIILFALWCATK